MIAIYMYESKRIWYPAKSLNLLPDLSFEWNFVAYVDNSLLI